MPKKRTRRLQDIAYSECEWGYGDAVAPRHGGPSAKYSYLAEGRSFLREVASFLDLSAKVHINPAGPASPGDVGLTATLSGGHILHVAIVYHESCAMVLWRIGQRSYAVDGANNWIEAPNSTAAEVAETISRGLKKRNEPEGGGNDQDQHHETNCPEV